MSDARRRVMGARVTSGGAPEAGEAAAIAAAVERFVADTAPPPPEPDEGNRLTGWQKAALLEGVGARDFVYPIKDPIR